MALIKPLKLRSEKVAVKQVRAKENPVVEVILDTKVFHLDQPYSYLVPEVLTEAISVGTLVKVPFGRTHTEGVVISRGQQLATAGLKYVDQALSSNSLFTPEQLALFSTVAQRYGVGLWDVVRLASPAFSAAGEKKFKANETQGVSEQSRKLERRAIRIQKALNTREQIARIVEQYSQNKVLILAPDQRTLDRYRDLADIALSGEDSKSERFKNYLQANTAKSGVVIGLRSSVFLHLGPNDCMIILNEVDENFYEKHTPTYNARDVALLRAPQNSIYFLASSFSLEISHLMDVGYIESVEVVNPRKNVIAAAPQRVHGVISEGLKKGSVLIVHANVGYVNSFSCQKCRNLALCECGSRLVLEKGSSSAACRLCSKKYEGWKCSFCNESRPYSLSQGIEKRVEDYGKSFPRVLVMRSTADSPVLDLPTEPTLVLATPGMAPQVEFAAVLLMDGEQIFGRIGLRSDEQGLLDWSDAANLLSESGTLYISLPSENPISQALIRGSFTNLYSHEISQRTSAQLPPKYRLATIDGESRDMHFVSESFEGPRADFDLHIIGPIERREGQSRLVLKFPTSRGTEIIKRIYEINRVRSLRGEKTLRVSVDPYDFI